MSIWISRKQIIESISCIALTKISEENNLFRDFTIQYLIQATFYEVCQLLLKHLEIKKKKLPHKEDIFKQFLKLVETHHYKERDISFYAEKLCLTPKYLSSIIRDVSGELAGNWIDNYVIIEAKALTDFFQPYHSGDLLINWIFLLRPHSPVSLNE